MKPPEGKDPPSAAKTGEPKPAGPAESDPLQKRIQAFEEERDRLKGELADVRDKHLRIRADYENLVKRVAKETQQSVRFAKGPLLLRVLTVAETLEKAEKELEAKHPADAKGVRLALEDVRRILRDEAVKEIDSLGHAFNYKHHQAVDRVETDQKPEGTVVEVVQRGYLVHGEVLRPALVKVAVPVRKPPSKEASTHPA